MTLSHCPSHHPFSHFLEAFPNLIELEMDAAVHDDDIRETNSLKKFVILGYKIKNPKCLLKMPHLQYFSMKWSKIDKLKEVKALKPFLPHNCRIYGRVGYKKFVEINV